MKLTLKKSLLLNMSSIILGLGLSVAALNASAAPEEAAKATVETAEKVNEVVTDEMNKPEAATSETVQTAEEAKASSVASATPQMSDINFKGVNSLRDGIALDEVNSPAEIKLLAADSLPIARNFFQQPPLVPHRIREYKITVRNNKCMSCHSWNNYKKAKATKVSQTHFEDRDGNAQSSLAARRYFCTQCHVPQVDAKPLIENNFMPVNELNK